MLGRRYARSGQLKTSTTCPDAQSIPFRTAMGPLVYEYHTFRASLLIESVAFARRSLTSKELRTEWRLKVKLASLESVEQWGNVSKACRAFGVSGAAFNRWRETYAAFGIEGLEQRKPIAKDHPRRIPETAATKVLELRQSYRLGPRRSSSTWNAISGSRSRS